MADTLSPEPGINLQPRYPRDFSAVTRLKGVIEAGVNGGLPQNVQDTLEGIGHIGGPDSPAEALGQLVEPYDGMPTHELITLAEQLFDDGQYVDSKLAVTALAKRQGTYSI